MIGEGCHEGFVGGSEPGGGAFGKADGKGLTEEGDTLTGVGGPGGGEGGAWSGDGVEGVLCSIFPKVPCDLGYGCGVLKIQTCEGPHTGWCVLEELVDVETFCEGAFLEVGCVVVLQGLW